MPTPEIDRISGGEWVVILLAIAVVCAAGFTLNAVL